MALVLILTCFLLFAGVWEYFRHVRSLQRIPVRIHINGTRGKSTTTRLIAAALREAGWQVIAKTTGSAARIILEDGREEAITRRGLPNIIEQKKLIDFAAKRRVDAVVVECMALHPENQWISEHRLLRATIGVITNVRPDHSDVMGDTLQDIARTLALTVPHRGMLVTTPSAGQDILLQKAAQERVISHVAAPDDISEQELSRFTYPVFRENAACALKVCELLGIPHEVALQGMANAAPDPGVMHVYKFKFRERTLYFVNAFAANDPISTSMAWHFLKQNRSLQFLSALPLIGLFNNRSDRGFRAKELSTWLTHSEFPLRDLLLLGQMNFVTTRYLKRRLGNQAHIHHVRRVHSPEALLNEIVRFCNAESVLFGFGNIKGLGQQLVEYAEAYGEKIL